METKFKARPRQIGATWIITIPKAFIDNGQIDPAREWEVTFDDMEATPDAQ